jgi:hypothetical protein
MGYQSLLVSGTAPPHVPWSTHGFALVPYASTIPLRWDVAMEYLPEDDSDEEKEEEDEKEEEENKSGEADGNGNAAGGQEAEEPPAEGAVPAAAD